MVYLKSLSELDISIPLTKQTLVQIICRYALGIFSIEVEPKAQVCETPPCLIEYAVCYKPGQ